MSWNADSDVFSFLGICLISLVSGFISIAQRIARGTAFTFLWVTSEFAAALLSGWLMWDAYPKIKDAVPEWCTLWVLVAVAAHVGGRGLQALEGFFYRRFGVREDPA